MPKLIKGERLTAKQIEQVKRAFIYRTTTENGYPKRNPCKATIPAISDSEWLKTHAFYIDAHGDLASKPDYCEPVYLTGQ